MSTSFAFVIAPLKILRDVPLSMGMSKHVAALVALSFAAVGCASSPVAAPADRLVFAIDAGFTAEEQTEILEAAADWNAVSEHPIALDTHAAWHVSPATSKAWTGIHEPSKERIELVSIAKLNDACFNGDGKGAFRTVVRHEFGHALGLQHIAGEGTMAPGHECAQHELSADDMVECRRVGACQ